MAFDIGGDFQAKATGAHALPATECIFPNCDMADTSTLKSETWFETFKFGDRRHVHYNRGHVSFGEHYTFNSSWVEEHIFVKWT